MGGPGRNKRAVSFGACGGARCQPGLWPWERPAAGGRRSVQHAVPQLMRRCLFRRAPPLSAWHSLLGPGCLVDRPRWGAWIHCREEGLATRPWGRDQPRAEGVHSRAGLRASRSRPWGGRSVPPRGAGWHLCCSRSGDTRPCVGHGRREQSRSSAGQLSVSEEGQRAGCQRQHWGTAGHSRGPHTPAPWLGPSSLCQPMAPSPQCSLGIAPHPKPLESDRPEHRS